MLGSEAPPAESYDVALLDLDGVVYVGPDAVPGATQALERAAAAGLRAAFVTNNAARPAATVAEHLGRLGVRASEEDVVTSAQAAARLLRERWGPDADVVALGAAGLRAALAAESLRAVGVEDDARAIVTGYGPDVAWRDLMRAAVRIRDGLPWVACNGDLTIPTPYGLAPGHGVQVEMLQRFSAVEPIVAGKPSPPLLREAIRRTGARRPLMVGDRLDTDIAGAHAVGIDSLLVLTGVTGLAELVTAGPGERPTYLCGGLDGLLEAHSPATPEDDGVRCTAWTARVDAGSDELSVRGEGSADDWWRAVACAAWEFADRTGRHVGISGLTPPR